MKSQRVIPALVILLPLLVSTIYFLTASYQLAESAAEKRNLLVEATDAFVKTFAETRGDGAPIPSEYRRLGIEHFTNQAAVSIAKVSSFRMPGAPGLEIAVEEQNARIKALIANLAADASALGHVEHRWEDGRFMGRSLYPSVATTSSCVTCHNDILGAEIYSLNDIMGAYVVETDLTAQLVMNLLYAVVIFLVALRIAVAIGRREQRQVKAVVEGLQSAVRLEKEKNEAISRATFLASHDKLTGLANRALFKERVAAALASAHDGLAVALIDIDEFRTVNETMGDEAGDHLLTVCANRVADVAARFGGSAARLGGDEFALVTGPSTGRDPSALGQALIEGLHRPVDFNGLEIKPQCSVGVSCADIAPARDVGELLKAADAALDQVKRSGKGGHRHFDQAIREALVRRAAMAGALRHAIEREEIRAVFQPQFCMRSGRLAGFEALARWRWSDEEISPAEFVPLAEEEDLVRELDLTVLRAATRFAAELEHTYGAEITVSSNISAINFRRSGLSERIRDILFETGLTPRLLTLEITESVLIKNWSRVAESLSPVQALGVQIALDDFGAGYSSLSYLHTFPFEEVKVDRVFIESLENDQEARFLFKSIIDLLRGLKKQVVVEGIETKKQADLVAQHGASRAQGFYFARPLEIGAARQLSYEHHGPVQAAGAAS